MNKEHTQTSTVLSKLGLAISWGLLILLAIMCSFWLIGSRVYLFDVLASHQMLWGWCMLVFTLILLIARRKKACKMVLFGMFFVCVAMFPVFMNRVWTLPQTDATQGPGSVIRIVTSNIHPVNTHWQDDLMTLLSMDADVVVVLESPPELSRSIRLRGLLDTTAYPYWIHRAWVEEETSPGFIISRWPMTLIEASKEVAMTQNHVYATIQHPQGEIVVGLLHPLSPRTQSRWEEGNRVIQTQALRIEEIRSWASPSTPLILGVDLNAGPAQVRARTLRRVGMRMSKPIFRIGGTFPSGNSVPAWLRIQLDDVWTQGPISPIAWSSIELVGSDHRAVVVDLQLNKD